MAAYTFDVLLNKTISDKWAENEGYIRALRMYVCVDWY